jgi:hypothetical protein
MLVTAYRKLGELLENPNALRRTISSQSLHGGAKRQGAEPVQRLGGDERITRSRAPSPFKLVSKGDDIVRPVRDNLQKRHLNDVAVTRDGDDLAAFTAVVPTVRLGNYSQILRKDFIIADNLAGALDLAGRRSSVAYNIAQNGAALRRDLEFNLCGVHTPAAGGSTSAARKTAPLTSWLTSNTSLGTNGVNPTLSGGIPNAGPVNGTQRIFSEALLKPVIQSCFENGGDPKFLMVNPFNKVKVSGFAGIAAQRYMAPDGPTTIIGSADVYVNTHGVAA